jgi:hypothetical protein
VKVHAPRLEERSLSQLGEPFAEVALYHQRRPRHGRRSWEQRDVATSSQPPPVRSSVALIGPTADPTVVSAFAGKALLSWAAKRHVHDGATVAFTSVVAADLRRVRP